MRIWQAFFHDIKYYLLTYLLLLLFVAETNPPPLRRIPDGGGLGSGCAPTNQGAFP